MFRLQIAATLFPEYPVHGLAAAVCSLRKALGITKTGSGSAHIRKMFCVADTCVLATVCEKIRGDPSTIYNAKSCDLRAIGLRNVWADSTANTAPAQHHTVYTTPLFYQYRIQAHRWWLETEHLHIIVYRGRCIILC